VNELQLAEYVDYLAKFVGDFETEGTEGTEGTLIWILDPARFTAREAALIEEGVRRRRPDVDFKAVRGSVSW
jgi:hypothetical protein